MWLLTAATKDTGSLLSGDAFSFKGFDLGHNLSQLASYSWRRTTVTETQTFSFGEQNFRVLATAGGAAPPLGSTGSPATPTPTPGTGAPVTGGR